MLKAAMQKDGKVAAETHTIPGLREISGQLGAENLKEGMAEKADGTYDTGPSAWYGTLEQPK